MRARTIFALAAFALAAFALAGACEPSTPVGSGANAALRVAGAQYVSGQFPVPAPDPDAGTAPPPPPDDAGDPDAATTQPPPPPRVLDVASLNNSVRAGTRARSLSGRASFNAMTVAIGLEGDPGYWIVPVGATDIENPPDLDFSASVDYADTLPPGPHRVLFAAADRAGQYGPARALAIDVPSVIPDSELAVSLAWDQDMDLDLVVIQPDGSVLTARGLRAPDGTRVPGSDPRISFDSNGGCAIDGRRREDGTWSAPQSGTYEVRVRVFSPCGLPAAGWHVIVARGGSVVGDFPGTSYAWEADAPGGGPDGMGRRVAQFSVE